MTLSEKIQDAISSIQLTGNSGRKYDNLIPLLTELTAVPGDDIHVTAADKVSNAGGRLLNGKHKTSGRHYRLCVLIISAQNTDGVVEKAKNHIDDRFQGYFDTIAIVNYASNSTQWVISYVVTNNVDNVADKIKSVYADAVVVEASNVVSGHEPSSSNESSASYSDLGSLVNSFKTSVLAAGLQYDLTFLRRFVAALLAKPFVILTGLSGSGKTKLAEAFASWLGTRFVEGDGTGGSRHLLVPVGADWSNNEHLLGYPDALHEGTYVLPDSKVLQFILAAKENPNDPYFLILDEMNLSHVERYFADFLSAMESSERTLHLHGVAAGLKAGVSKASTDAAEKPEADDDKSDKLIIPADLELPDNLFVIGTMNVDETTYMVSPKVLDRAQTLEFRVSHKDIDDFLSGSPAVDMKKLKDGSGNPLGGSFAGPFLTLAKGRAGRKPSASFATDLNASLLAAFDKLSELGAEFAFRSTAEIVAFVAFAEEAGLASDQAIDAAILQKLLPKVHGSRRKLERPLGALWDVCRKDGKTTLQETRDQFGKPFYEGCCRFPWSGEKIARMYRQAVDNGFASFAEA